MPGKTNIEWCDAVWNPIRGCTRVSEGCRNCYAERQAIRVAGEGKPYHGLVQIREITAGRKKRRVPQWTGKVVFDEAVLDYPGKLRKPHRIFVNSMSDLFHPDVRDEWLAAILATMCAAKQHTYLVLTKRAARLRDWCRSWCGFLGKESMPAHVWFGVSVENQETAEARIPELLATPAAVRWISYEPALGPLDVELALCSCPMRLPFGSGTRHLLSCKADCRRPDDPRRWPLDWIVAGGESGPDARPAHPDWFRSVRDQCAAAGVPFFFKQWGEWAGGDYFYVPARKKVRVHEFPDGLRSFACGKKNAGRLLDGREWNEFPVEIHTRRGATGR